MHTILLFALCSLYANAAPIADDHDGDIVATYTVTATPAVVAPLIGDLRTQESLLTSCTRKWVHGETSSGIGASAELVYKIGMWRRKLTGTISKFDGTRQVVVDHAGKKGFLTSWTLTEVDGGTQIELRTLMNMPPKPFRKAYANQVQPKWQACYAEALVKLENSLP